MTDAFASHAEHQFELSAKQDDGKTLREHLEAVAERSGKRPAMLDGPGLPAPCARLWGDFLELHGARGYGMAGPDRITFRDLMDWQEFRGVKLDGWQIDAIRKADDAYFASLPKAKTK